MNQKQKQMLAFANAGMYGNMRNQAHFMTSAEATEVLVHLAKVINGSDDKAEMTKKINDLLDK